MRASSLRLDVRIARSNTSLPGPARRTALPATNAANSTTLVKSSRHWAVRANLEYTDPVTVHSHPRNTHCPPVARLDSPAE
jgi:hypothetical protein